MPARKLKNFHAGFFSYDMSSLLLVVVASLAFVSGSTFPDCENGPLAGNLVCDPNAPALDRAQAIVAEFTIPELIQNTGNESPGVSRLSLSAYNWWNESFVWLIMRI
ncbi:hypothetical protein MPER_01711 [Moniliophthora perniciosa FA553]|nr:hypothetical protein MPER_01711 [Moniliophthora perniciosa FA553]